jgi:methanogenic corrinoid protein MtbC1
LKQDTDQYLQAIGENFLAFKYFEAQEATKQALAAGVPREEVAKVFQGLFLEALARYEDGKYSIAHLTAAQSLFEMGLDLAKAKITPKGKVVIGTLGSSHYLGKDIIRLLLAADGFEVIDLGEIVFPDQFVEAVEKEKPDIVAVAVMIIACLPLQRAMVGMLELKGLRDKVKVLIGGGVTSPRWAADIGADGWAERAPQALAEANRLLQELKEGV